MALRVISISKMLFDDRWEEQSSAKIGTKEQHSLNFMLVMKAKSEQAKIRVKIVGHTAPQEMIFRLNSIVRIGSGMLVYEKLDLDETKTKPLKLHELDNEF